MPYKAKHYVTHNGELYCPGDTLPDSLTPEDVKWLAGAGAILEIPESSSAKPTTTNSPKEAKPRENTRRKNKQSV